jgi:hypothetical protein
VERKTTGPEKGELGAAELGFHQAEYTRLISLLETEAAKTQLPDEPTGREALNELLVRIRLQGL